MTRTTFSALFAATLLLACSPKITNQFSKTYPPLQPWESLIVFELTDSLDAELMRYQIGEIAIEDNGLAINCDYHTVLDSAKTRARLNGANALKIISHKLPGTSAWGSTCHRIRAIALRLPDTSPYEREIAWHENRRLRIADFKADTAQRPFAAATLSTLKSIYRLWSGASPKAQIRIESIFLCQHSYFKSSPDSNAVLQHEQGHFDLTEIQARKLRRQIKSFPFHANSFETDLKRLFENANLELQTRQDQYDHDIYPNPERQGPWLEKIRQELTDLAAFRDPDLTVPVNR